MKDMKVSLTQNIHRAISEAHRCGKIPLGSWVPHTCVNGGLWHPSIQISDNDNAEDEDKRYVDTLAELD